MKDRDAVPSAVVDYREAKLHERLRKQHLREMGQNADNDPLLKCYRQQALAAMKDIADPSLS